MMLRTRRVHLLVRVIAMLTALTPTLCFAGSTNPKLQLVSFNTTDTQRSRKANANFTRVPVRANSALAGSKIAQVAECVGGWTALVVRSVAGTAAARPA
jgi:hypothetical protein